ncbi:unnamed protein product, partial [Meganyctiphanes norvegica]
MAINLIRQSATLHGRVTVNASLRNLNPDARNEMGNVCIYVVCNSNATHKNAWLGEVEKTFMTVEVVIDTTNSQILLYDDESLLCQHPMKQLGVINQMDEYLVYIGKCLVNINRLAVVLCFSSAQMAIDVARNVQMTKEACNSAIHKSESVIIRNQNHLKINSKENIPEKPCPSQEFPINQLSMLKLKANSNVSDNDMHIIPNEDQFRNSNRPDNMKQEGISIQDPSKTDEKSVPVVENALFCLIQEEESYIEGIRLIKKDIRKLPYIVRALLEPVKELLPLHESLYADISNEKNTDKIAEAFHNRNQEFVVYKYVMLNAHKIQQKLQEIDGPDQIEYQHLREPIRKTIVRLHFYFMTLEQLLDCSSDEAKEKFKETIDIFHNYCQLADTGILIDEVKHSPIFLHLQTPLLLHNNFQVYHPVLNQNQAYKVLLFETIIVLTSNNSDCNEYVLDFRIEQSRLIMCKETNEFLIEVNNGNVKGKEHYKFKAESQEIKDKWVSEIMAIQKRYMEKIKSLS